MARAYITTLAPEFGRPNGGPLLHKTPECATRGMPENAKVVYSNRSRAERWCWRCQNVDKQYVTPAAPLGKRVPHLRLVG